MLVMPYSLEKALRECDTCAQIHVTYPSLCEMLRKFLLQFQEAGGRSFTALNIWKQYEIPDALSLITVQLH